MKLLVTLQRSGGVEGLARHAGLPVERASGLGELLFAPLMLGMRDAVRAAGGGEAGVRAIIDIIAAQGGGGLAAQILTHDAIDPRAGRALVECLLPLSPRRDELLDRFTGKDLANRDEIEQFLPLLAMLVCGYLSAQVGGSGTSGSGGLKNLGPVLDFLTSEVENEDALWLL